jgi:hypothetical protein
MRSSLFIVVAPPPALLPVHRRRGRQRRRTDGDDPERGHKDGDRAAVAAEMTLNAGARMGPRGSMDRDRVAAVELAQPARAQRRMEHHLEFNLFRSTPIILYTIQNEEYVLPSIGDSLTGLESPTAVLEFGPSIRATAAGGTKQGRSYF